MLVAILSILVCAENFFFNNNIITILPLSVVSSRPCLLAHPASHLSKVIIDIITCVSRSYSCPNFSVRLDSSLIPGFSSFLIERVQA